MFYRRQIAAGISCVTSKILREEQSASIKIMLSSGTSGSFPEGWRSGSGCVRELLHVDALFVCKMRYV